MTTPRKWNGLRSQRLQPQGVEFARERRVWDVGRTLQAGPHHWPSEPLVPSSNLLILLLASPGAFGVGPSMCHQIRHTLVGAWGFGGTLRLAWSRICPSKRWWRPENSSAPGVKSSVVSRLGGLRVPKPGALRGPKSARDCGQTSKLLVEKRLTNANSDAPSEVHQLSRRAVNRGGQESIFGECRSRAAWVPIDKIRPV